MAKTFAEKMKEVAQNSRDMNKKYPPPTVNTAPKGGPMSNKEVQTIGKASTTLNKGRDVNLPLSTASPEVKKRLGIK